MTNFDQERLISDFRDRVTETRKQCHVLNARQVFEVIGYVAAAMGAFVRHFTAVLAAREKRIVEVVVRLFAAELKGHEQRIAELERKLGVATASDEKRTGGSA